MRTRARNASNLADVLMLVLFAVVAPIRFLLGRLRFLIFHVDTEYAEILSGLLALGWGLYILYPPPNEVQNDVFRAMLGIAPRIVWGVVVSTCATLQLLGVVLGIDRLRQAMAIVVVGPFWTFISVVIFLSGYRTVSALAYGLFALTCSMAYLRIAWGIAGGHTARVRARWLREHIWRWLAALLQLRGRR